MKNKDLLRIAMPFVSLSDKQWDNIVNFADNFSDKESELYKTLQTLIVNQSRLEIISDYNFYYDDKNREESIIL